MINKQEAKAKGMRIIAPDEKAKEEREHKLNQLKALMPSLVNGDGKVNIQALEDFIEPNNLASRKQGYQLTFAGKGLARAIADASTKKEFRLEKDQSKNFDKTENVIIRGDNLDVLKLLQQNYSNKVKMIYIDPPYNTGSDVFLYKDHFKMTQKQLTEELKIDEDELDYLTNTYGTKAHSGWLSFIYPRLKLARDLLTDDGAIFISIDDNEQANLKLMCDEIFGEENFITQFVWQTKNAARGVPTTTMLIPNFEYILCYAAKKHTFSFQGEERNEEDFSNPDNDARGLWRSESMKSTLSSSDKKFSIIDPKTNIAYKNTWAFSKTTIEKMIKEDLIIFPRNGGGLPRQKKFIHSYKNTTKAIVPNLGWFSTEHATKKFMKLFDNKKLFDFPKPVDLMKLLTKQATSNNDIILDFFAGSGTTAEAVMSLNKEDGGNRKFILVQWDEAIPKKTPGYDFCTEHNLAPVISSICIERVNRAGEKIKAETSKQKNLLEDDKKLPDTGYRVFSLVDRPELDGKQLQLNINRNTALDTLYNMMAISGEALLTDGIEEIEKDKLYKVNNAYYLLGDCKTDLKKADSVFVDGYADISLNKWLNTLCLNKDKVSILY